MLIGANVWAKADKKSTGEGFILANDVNMILQLRNDLEVQGAAGFLVTSQNCFVHDGFAWGREWLF